ncbi:putative tannase subunit protein [Botrytis fragariae]|uniref:Carboxylic ester hydrolase n=1 Tax=Botrytis fragariae TaxID=1964551 RepID=A0A8H6B4D0_9HELO|nr:putative tannase subunit protein [Botrytis fragariae]KAF5878767.1 putative tannase subunit protein [Botrytis fragariae]
MRKSLFAIAAAAATASADSLTDICTTAVAKAALPADGTLFGSSVIPSSVTANVVYNTSVSGQTFFPDATVNFCNVTFSYTHNGRGDNVVLTLWLPAPENFENRWLSSGGMAYSINSGTSNLVGGVMYGAASGLTDGGFDTVFDSVFLLENGTINWEPTYMFGYQALGELTTLGKEFTKQFYDMGDNKLYAYYQGCSDGGREGWSQAQRWGDIYDGIIAGAPAFRYGQQQVNHLFSNVVEQTLDYYPSPCEFELIVNETISNCDALDGKVDGVVARTDLCKLHYNINQTIGLPYSCAASSGGGIGLGYGKRKRQMTGGTTTPAANGTVSAEAVAVAQTILDGLHDSQGRRAYLSYQPSADFEDAATTYNSDTDSYELSIAGTGGEWVARFLELQDLDNLSSLDNVTYDTLVQWMVQGWTRYEDSLQTNNPDLTDIYNYGGKILHFHGESDPSVPAASSVHYYESVRSIMYPGLSFNESTEALKEWYRLYMVPGAAHCAINSEQENGPFPQTNLQVLIEWVENDTVPVTLNATHLAGDYKGDNAQICAWPLRPLWINNGTTQDCVFDQASYDTWTYTFDAFKRPLY